MELEDFAYGGGKAVRGEGEATVADCDGVCC